MLLKIILYCRCNFFWKGLTTAETKSPANMEEMFTIQPWQLALIYESGQEREEIINECKLF